MIYLQDESVEDLIRRTQQTMHACDQHAASYDVARAEEMAQSTHSGVFLLALGLQRPSRVHDLTQILEQLITEVAGARDAVEAERALRRML